MPCTRIARRIPAVSTNRILPAPGHSTSASTLSRVVPASSKTTARSSPTSRLNRLDLPTFGRPTSANLGSSDSPSAISRPTAPPAASLSSASGASGMRSATRSRSSPIPRPCCAETAIGSPSPREWKRGTSASSCRESALLTTTRTGEFARRRRRASCASSSVIREATSTTSRMSCASSMARTACLPASASTPLARWRYPAVSTSPKRLPFHVASSSTRSLVTPGSSGAIASRLPKSLLTRVDLPTFCRPTTAILGTVMASNPREELWRPFGDDPERGAERAGHVEIARVDHDRVLGRHGWIHTRVPSIPLEERAGHLRRSPFLHSPAGALLWRCDQEHLHRRVGEHGGADVAPLHHGTPLTEGPLGGPHRGSDLRVPRDRAHVRPDISGVPA